MLPSSRDTLLARLLSTHGPVLTRTQLRDAGLSDKDVHRLSSAGALTRLRRGVLVDGATWRTSTPWDRHALRARAFAASLLVPDEGRLALSHHSALAVLGLSTFGVDDDVHMCRLRPGRSYRSAGLRVHGTVSAEHTTLVDGIRVVSPALACLGVAAAFGVEAGLVAADSALRTQRCGRDDLAEVLDLPALRVGRGAARLVTELADGRRESAGESRSGWLLHGLPIPRPVPQVLIRDRREGVVARVDFLLEGTKVVVEFDGMLKYAGVLDVHAEKRREDRLRDLGYEVVRITWDDLSRPDLVLEKIRAALERAAARAAG